MKLDFVQNCDKKCKSNSCYKSSHTSLAKHRINYIKWNVILPYYEVVLRTHSQMNSKHKQSYGRFLKELIQLRQNQSNTSSTWNKMIIEVGSTSNCSDWDPTLRGPLAPYVLEKIRENERGDVKKYLKTLVFSSNTKPTQYTWAHTCDVNFYLLEENLLKSYDTPISSFKISKDDVFNDIELNVALRKFYTVITSKKKELHRPDPNTQIQKAKQFYQSIYNNVDNKANAIILNKTQVSLYHAVTANTPEAYFSIGAKKHVLGLQRVSKGKYQKNCKTITQFKGIANELRLNDITYNDYLCSIIENYADFIIHTYHEPSDKSKGYNSKTFSKSKYIFRIVHAMYSMQNEPNIHPSIQELLVKMNTSIYDSISHITRQCNHNKRTLKNLSINDKNKHIIFEEFTKHTGKRNIENVHNIVFSIVNILREKGVVTTNPKSPKIYYTLSGNPYITYCKKNKFGKVQRHRVYIK